MDDVYESVYKMKKRIRTLEQALENLAGEVEQMRAGRSLSGTGRKTSPVAGNIVKTFEEELGVSSAEKWVETANRKFRGFENLMAARAEDVDATDKELVYRIDKMKPYHYKGASKRKCPLPILICCALVNRRYMTDLQPDRSLIRNLLDRGPDIYIIDRGYPGNMDKFIEFDDYIDIYLLDTINHIRTKSCENAVNLLGVCRGGVQCPRRLIFRWKTGS